MVIKKQLRIKSYFYLIFALLFFHSNNYSLAEIKNLEKIKKISQENHLDIEY